MVQSPVTNGWHNEQAHVDRDYVVVDRLESRSSDESGSQNVSIGRVEAWSKEILDEPINRLALTALSTHSPASVLTTRAALVETPPIFSVTLAHDGAPVTNQRHSGRCWLFAATNVFRIALMRRHRLKEFQLSQSYLFFWDKLEKANYFLEQVLQTAGQELDGREVQALLASPISDGGQWDMAANLVEKYGLVPQSLYPDAFSAKDSGAMDHILTTRLRADALELRRLASAASRSELLEKKEAMLRDVHRILTLTLGPPPSPTAPFTWDFYDQDNGFHSVELTPLELADELRSKASASANDGMRVHELFSLVHDPRHDPLTLLTVSRLGNVLEGRPVTYVNATLQTMKRACVAMLRAGQPVFFGSDVGQYRHASGLLDPGLVDYSVAFGVPVGSATALSKAERLTTRESAMTHAMVLTGVHVLPAGKGEEETAGPGERAVRWRIENSWGKDSGEKGYWVMTDAWMSEFVYQAVVDPRFVGEDVRDVLKQEPLVLPLWDPMGALA